MHAPQSQRSCLRRHILTVSYNIKQRDLNHIYKKDFKPQKENLSYSKLAPKYFSFEFNFFNLLATNPNVQFLKRGDDTVDDKAKGVLVEKGSQFHGLSNSVYSSSVQMKVLQNSNMQFGATSKGPKIIKPNQEVMSTILEDFLAFHKITPQESRCLTTEEKFGLYLVNQCRYPTIVEHNIRKYIEKKTPR